MVDDVVQNKANLVLNINLSGEAEIWVPSLTEM